MEHLRLPTRVDRAKYQMSMAGPAANADGLDKTALPAPEAILRVLRQPIYDDRLDEPEEGLLDQLVVDDAAPEEVDANETSTPIEIWEGVVSSVEVDSMSVVLRATMNRAVPEQTMDLDLGFVQPQDRDLVAPGAVFYLTMYKQTTGKTIRNSEDITFRRRPDWTSSMHRKLRQLAAEL